MALNNPLSRIGLNTGKILLPIALLLGAGVIVKESIFYAEPGYVYHVRTITGQEHAVSDVGYQFFLWGRWNAWKRAMTVQSEAGAAANMEYAEVEGDETSANMPPLNIMFLD